MSIRGSLRRIHSGMSGDAFEQFERFQWGNRPDKVLSVDAKHMRVRQDLVQIGWWQRTYLALPSGKVRIIRAQRPYPFLAFGASDNRLYLVGGSLAKMARAGKLGAPGVVGAAIRTDYTSKKGRRSGVVYYWHTHEAPYAAWFVHRDGFASYVGGGYTVSPEGIVD